MQGICRSCVALFLIAGVFSATVFAQADKAILYPGQGITLNGSAIQTSSAVVSGDTIATGNGSGQLTAHGLVAQIHPNSSLQYGDVIILNCGGVIASSDANAVQASDTRVTPKGGTAKFEMINRGGKLTINVQSGTVKVSSDTSTTLTAGQSSELPSSDTCPAIVSGKPVAPGATGKGKWILIGAAAGGAAAGVYIVERKPSSPSEP